MTRVIVDASLHVKLPQLNSALTFCDESGRTLGYYVPAPDQLREMYEWARREFTDEEIDRARREPPGDTTAEVLRQLRRQ